MSDISPNAMSLEDAPTGAEIDSQPIVQEPVQQAATDDAEPEGVVEHQGRRMVDVSVLAAERRRVRESTAAAVREKELAPLQQAVTERDQLRAVLAELRPLVEDVRKYGVGKPAPPSKAEELVTDDEAAAEARDLELYDGKTGQPDIARAKRIIARRRQDVTSAAQQAAQAAVGPITSQSAAQASRSQLQELASMRGNDNQPLLGSAVDPKVLAELWASLPSELTQHREVAELVMNAAIGKTLRTKGHALRAERAPVVTEPSGGRSGPSWELDRMAKSLAKNAGITEADFKKTATAYQPGASNALGD